MSDHKRQFSWRATTSVLISLTFIVMILSGTILLFSPPGRVANWTGWRMLGYTKHEWSDLHVWFAVLFVVGGLLHTVFNFRQLLSYFRNRVTRRLGFRWEWLVAVVIAGLVFAGTRADLPPFATLLAFSERIKRSWEDPRTAAPIPHAELLTVQELAETAGVPLETALERLNRRSLQGVSPTAVAGELAARNGLSAQRLYELLQDAPARGGKRGPRDESGPSEGAGRPGQRPAAGRGGGGGGGGPGRMTLTEYCESRGLDVQEVEARLHAQGITLRSGQTLREIAVENGYERPFELIDIIEQRTAQ